MWCLVIIRQDACRVLSNRFIVIPLQQQRLASVIKGVSGWPFWAEWKLCRLQSLWEWICCTVVVGLRRRVERKTRSMNVDEVLKCLFKYSTLKVHDSGSRHRRQSRGEGGVVIRVWQGSKEEPLRERLVKAIPSEAVLAVMRMCFARQVFCCSARVCTSLSFCTTSAISNVEDPGLRPSTQERFLLSLFLYKPTAPLSADRGRSFLHLHFGEFSSPSFQN